VDKIEILNPRWKELIRDGVFIYFRVRKKWLAKH
jgi:hypothetical protein